jgi:hypothetical protein
LGFLSGCPCGRRGGVCLMCGTLAVFLFCPFVGVCRVVGVCGWVGWGGALLGPEGTGLTLWGVVFLVWLFFEKCIVDASILIVLWFVCCGKCVRAYGGCLGIRSR